MKEVMIEQRSSFLGRARKEAKELFAKFNARDEFRSLLPDDGEKHAIKSRFIHRFANSLDPPKFRARSKYN